MRRYFTKTFALFLFGFLCIIALGFGVAALVGPAVPPAPVDNTAQSR